MGIGFYLGKIATSTFLLKELRISRPKSNLVYYWFWKSQQDFLWS